ncbi:MAG: Rieske 2Fe-2S domain-containing protein [Planctomycetes bacterium]|nr:Rieske 2Fe-2S domain-containing protein [Planctomycetota bacterium]
MLSKFLKLFRKAVIVIPGADKLAEGEARTVQLGDGLKGGKKILICRAEGGAVYALDTHCPHDEGGELLPGPLFGGDKAVCPLHNYHFDVRTGKVVKGACKNAVTYKIKEVNGEFHLTI